MPAPSNYPDWGTDETNNVEPPAGKIAEGWLPAEQPPASWFNWWKNLVGAWVRWLESVTNTLSGRIDTNDTDISTLQTDLDTLEASHDVLALAAAIKAEHNIFLKSQTINSEANHADDALVKTTAKPGDDPTDLSGVPAAAGSNRWKAIISVPTQGSAYAGVFVGQSPDGAALINNARWNIATQRWVQIDPAYPSTGIVGRSGQWVASYVSAGASPWADWPFDAGGDFIAGGNVGANGHLLYVPPHAANDFTIPLSCSSGETFMQTDGSYKVGPDGASWPLKVPDLTVLSDIYIIYYSASASLSYGALVRRDKGSVLLPTAFPAFETVSSMSGPGAVGVQLITLSTTGHVAETASWEYSVIFKRAHVDDKVGRIALGTFTDIGPRNLG